MKISFDLFLELARFNRNSAYLFCCQAQFGNCFLERENRRLKISKRISEMQFWFVPAFQHYSCNILSVITLFPSQLNTHSYLFSILYPPNPPPSLSPMCISLLHIDLARSSFWCIIVR